MALRPGWHPTFLPKPPLLLLCSSWQQVALVLGLLGLQVLGIPTCGLCHPHLLSQGEVLPFIKSMIKFLRHTVEASTPTRMVSGGLWEINRMGPLDGIGVPTSTLSAL